MRNDLSLTLPQIPSQVILSTKILLVTIAYIFLGYLCTSSPVWFPAGLGLTALLFWGPMVGLGIFSGDFLLNLMSGEAWEFSIIIASGNTLGAIIGLKCLRFFHFSPHLLFLKDVLNLIFWAALLATTINATLETLYLIFNENLFGSNLQRTWSLLWLGDSTGVLLLTPFLLRLKYDWRAIWLESSRLRWLEASLCLGLLGSVGWLVFDAEKMRMDALLAHLSSTQYLEYLPFPFVIWAAIRFSLWGAVSANLLVALLAISGAMTGVGTFVLQIANYEQAILLLQIFLMILATTSLCLSAAMNERQQLNNTLEEQVIERTLQLRAKMQEQEQLLQMKTVFFQAVVHDLRTSIMGLSMLLNNLPNTDAEILLSSANLKRISQSSDRQLTLINALAEDHFAEQHLLSLQRQSVSLTEIINPLLNDLSPLFVQNKSKLINEIPTDLPKINVDHSQIRLVFEQLLTNAVKHNPPEIQIILAATVESNSVKCTISDNGIGMTPDQCQNLFKLYVRNLHNHRLTGIGLGSYQCRQIIEAHGGQIGVESTLKSGSQFWFTLPLA